MTREELYRECTGKRRFPTSEAAEAEAAALKISGQTRDELRFYSCIWCRGFHLTSRPNRQDELGDI